jgi:hypothetical protein
LKDAELLTQCQVLCSDRSAPAEQGADELLNTGHDAHLSSSIRDL